MSNSVHFANHVLFAFCTQILSEESLKSEVQKQTLAPSPPGQCTVIWAATVTQCLVPRSVPHTPLTSSFPRAVESLTFPSKTTRTMSQQRKMAHRQTHFMPQMGGPPMTLSQKRVTMGDDVVRFRSRHLWIHTRMRIIITKENRSLQFPRLANARRVCMNSKRGKITITMRNIPWCLCSMRIQKTTSWIIPVIRLIPTQRNVQRGACICADRVCRRKEIVRLSRDQNRV